MKQKFELLAKNQNNEENIKKMLKNEKNKLKKLRNSLMRLSKEVNSREKEIDMIKMLDNIYYEIQFEKEKNIENIMMKIMKIILMKLNQMKKKKRKKKKKKKKENIIQKKTLKKINLKVNNENQNKENSDNNNKNNELYLNNIDFKIKEKTLKILGANDYLKKEFKKFKDFNDILILLQKGIQYIIK